MASTPNTLNLASYFVDARLAEGRGGRVAVRDYSAASAEINPGVTTYQNLADASARVAHLLAALDIRPEERVIIALPDGAAFVEVLFGILRHGAVVVMVNPDAPPDLLAYFCEYTRATAVFVDRAHLAALTAAIAGVGRKPRLVPIDDPQTMALAATAAETYDPFPAHRDDPAIWLFSGGTTGRPKAVIQTNRSFVNTTVLYGQRVLALSADDITMAVPKLFFGYALGSNVFFPFSVGASCVLFSERSTADTVARLCRVARPTVLISVPTMVHQMVSAADVSAEDLASLRLVTSAGEALPAELHARWTERFGVELLDGLGTAEMWHIFLTNHPGRVVPGTLGHVVEGFEVKLCDAEGLEVVDGEAGVLWVRGESRALAYWQRLDDTVQAFRGEWYVSGDMLRKLPSGAYEYCGRADDMLKVSGKWLAPGELENCLLQHEAVREVAVVGVKNRDGLVKPCAFVVTDRAAPELAAELQAFAKSHLEPYKYPRLVVFVDSLPRTHLGKVDRHVLATTGVVEPH